CLLPERLSRGGRSPCRDATSHCPCMHSGEGAEAGVEDQARLVPGRPRGSDDQSGYAAVLGAAHGRTDSIGNDRPRPTGYRTGIGRRNDPRGRNQFGGPCEYVEVVRGAAQAGAYDMAALPLIVFDINETLLDLQTLEPTFERIFGDKSAMRLWFANLIMYSAALTVAGCYVPFTDIGSPLMEILAGTPRPTNH